jgi:hypothetical protein
MSRPSPRSCRTEKERWRRSGPSTTRIRPRDGGRGWRISSPSSATKGSMTAEVAAQPGPDPALFGMPSEDDGTRTDVLLGQNLITNNHFEPDIDVLRRASTRIVVAAGRESEGEMAHRGAPRRRRQAGHGPGHVRQRPRRLPGGRVRPVGRPGRLRRRAEQPIGKRGMKRPQMADRYGDPGAE